MTRTPNIAAPPEKSAAAPDGDASPAPAAGASGEPVAAVPDGGASPPSPAPLAGGPGDPDRHFRTDHLHADLKGRSVRGGAVTMAAQGVKFVLQLGSTMALARLLTPADFGLIAMAAAVTGFASMFKDAGLSMATVQRERITHAQVSTLFWVNVALSLALMVLLAALAPAVAWAYGDPRLTSITLALAGTFLFGGLTIQHQALLKRQMRFTALAVIQVCSMAAGVAAAITAALLGAGYWALVVMTAVSAATTAALAWLLSGWIPGKPQRGAGTRPLLAFGANLTGASVLNYIGSASDKILLGWAWGASVLGLYDRAFRLMQLPLRQINAPLSSIAVPALSRAADAPLRYRRAFSEFSEKLTLMAAPMAALTFICADWVILAVLGEQWTGAADILRVLGLTSLILPLWNATGWLFVSQGRTREHLHFHVVNTAAKWGSVLVGLPWGALGISIAILCRYAIVAPFLFHVIGRGGPVRSVDLYRTLALPAAVAGATMGTLAILRQIAPAPPPWIGLLMAAATGMATVLAVLLALPHGRKLIQSLASDIRMLLPRRGKGVSYA